MKNSKRALLVLAVFLCFSSSILAQSKIGYVNTELVMERVEEAKTILNKIKSLRQDYQKGILKLQGELELLEEQLERQKLILTVDKREELLKQIETKKTAILDYERDKLLDPSGEMYSKAAQLRQPLIDKVLKAIEMVAKDKGFDLILDNSSSLVLFASGNVDFTNDVILYLDQNQSKQDQGDTKSSNTSGKN